MSGHIEYRETPICIKCGYTDMDWEHIDGNVQEHKYEYIALICRRCGFYASMSCKDEVKIEPFTEQLEKDMKEVEDKGGIKWHPDQN